MPSFKNQKMIAAVDIRTAIREAVTLLTASLVDKPPQPISEHQLKTSFHQLLTALLKPGALVKQAFHQQVELQEALIILWPHCCAHLLPNNASCYLPNDSEEFSRKNLNRIKTCSKTVIHEVLVKPLWQKNEKLIMVLNYYRSMTDCYLEKGYCSPRYLLNALSINSDTYDYMDKENAQHLCLQALRVCDLASRVGQIDQAYYQATQSHLLDSLRKIEAFELKRYQLLGFTLYSPERNEAAPMHDIQRQLLGYLEESSWGLHSGEQTIDYVLHFVNAVNAHLDTLKMTSPSILETIYWPWCFHLMKVSAWKVTIVDDCPQDSHKKAVESGELLLIVKQEDVYKLGFFQSKENGYKEVVINSMAVIDKIKHYEAVGDAASTVEIKKELHSLSLLNGGDETRFCKEKKSAWEIICHQISIHLFDHTHIDDSQIPKLNALLQKLTDQVTTASLCQALLAPLIKDIEARYKNVQQSGHVDIVGKHRRYIGDLGSCIEFYANCMRLMLQPKDESYNYSLSSSLNDEKALEEIPSYQSMVTHQQILSLAYDTFYKPGLSEQTIEERQARYTQSVMDKLRVIIAECQTILGPPPCHYCVLGFGSISRAELFPGSDLDVALLIEDGAQQRHEYFKHLVRLLDFRLCCLANHLLTLDSMDLSLIEVGDAGIINTPEIMVNKVVMKKDRSHDLHDIAPYGIERSIELYASNSCDLFQKFQTLLQEAWNSPDEDEPEFTKAQRLGRDYIEGELYGNSISSESDYLRLIDEGVTLDSKLMIIKMLNLWVMSLGRHLNYVKEHKPRALLSLFRDEQRWLDPALIDAVDKALKVGHFLRARSFSPTKVDPIEKALLVLPHHQNDTAAIADNFPLSVEEYRYLRYVAHGIIVPLYETRKTMLRVIQSVRAASDALDSKMTEELMEDEQRVVLDAARYQPLETYYRQLLETYVQTMDNDLGSQLSIERSDDAKHIELKKSMDAKQLLDAADLDDSMIRVMRNLFPLLEHECPADYHRLMSIKGRDGWQASILKNQWRFQRDLQAALFCDEKMETEEVGDVVSLDLSCDVKQLYDRGFHRLKPEVANQLFTSERFVSELILQEKASNLRGRHTVLSLSSEGKRYWVKFRPERYDMEDGIHALDSLLTNEADIPASQLVCFNLEKTEYKVGRKVSDSYQVAAQITEHVPGLSLHAVAEVACQPLAQSLKQFTLSQWSENQLCATRLSATTCDELRDYFSKETSLGEIQRVCQYQLRHIDRASFTRTLLRVLLINPEDDKGDDYRLVPIAGSDYFQLVRLDNERAFFKSVETVNRFSGQFRKPKLIVKSMLYCLDEMRQPLDEDTLRDFLEHNNKLLLQRWLMRLTLLHEHMNILFSETTVRQHYRRDAALSSYLAVMLPEHLMTQLLTCLDNLQARIRLALNQQEALTGLTLLACIRPALKPYYWPGFIEANASRDWSATMQRYQTVLACYQQNALGHYQTDYTSHASLSLSMAEIVPIESRMDENVLLRIRKGETASYWQAWQELAMLREVNVTQVVEKFKQVQSNVKRLFCKLSAHQQLQVIKEISLFLTKHPEHSAHAQIQRLLLDALADDESIPIRWHRLDCRSFATGLTMPLFSAMVRRSGAYLSEVNMSNCQRLEANSALRIIATYCPHLVKLQARNLENLTHLQGTWYTPHLSLTNLLYLDVSGCQNLQAIDIDAPRLRMLKMDGCRQLTKFRVGQAEFDRYELILCWRAIFSHTQRGRLAPQTYRTFYNILDALWQKQKLVQLPEMGERKRLALLVDVLHVPKHRQGNKLYELLIAIAEVASELKDSVLWGEYLTVSEVETKRFSYYFLSQVLIKVAKAAGELKDSKLLGEVLQVMKNQAAQLDRVNQYLANPLERILVQLVEAAAGKFQDSKLLGEVLQVTQAAQKRLGKNFDEVLAKVAAAAGKLQDSALLGKVWRVAQAVHCRVDNISFCSYEMLAEVAAAAGKLQDSMLLGEVLQVTQAQAKRRWFGFSDFKKVLVQVTAAAVQLQDSTLLGKVLQVIQAQAGQRLYGSDLRQMLGQVAAAAGKFQDSKLLGEVLQVTQALAQANRLTDDALSRTLSSVVGAAVQLQDCESATTLLGEVLQVTQAQVERLYGSDLRQMLGQVVAAAGKFQDSKLLGEVLQVTQAQVERLTQAQVERLYGSDLRQMLGQVAAAAGKFQDSKLLGEVLQVTQALAQANRLTGDALSRVLSSVAEAAGGLQDSESVTTLLGKVLQVTQALANRLLTVNALSRALSSVVDAAVQLQDSESATTLLGGVLQVTQAQANRLTVNALSRALSFVVGTSVQPQDCESATTLLGGVLQVTQALAQANRLTDDALSRTLSSVVSASVQLQDCESATTLLGEVLQVTEALTQAQANRLTDDALSRTLSSVVDAAVQHQDSESATSLLREVLQVTQALAQANRLTDDALSRTLSSVVDAAVQHQDSESATRLFGEVLQVTEALTQANRLDGKALSRTLSSVATAAGGLQDSKFAAALLVEVLLVTQALAQANRLTGDALSRVLSSVALNKRRIELVDSVEEQSSSLSDEVLVSSSAFFFSQSHEEEKRASALPADTSMSQATQLSELEDKIAALEQQRVILLYTNQQTPSSDIEKQIEALDAQLARLQTGHEDLSVNRYAKLTPLWGRSASKTDPPKRN